MSFPPSVIVNDEPETLFTVPLAVFAGGLSAMTDPPAAPAEAIRQKPDFSRAYNARGFAYLRQRDYQHALADFDEAIKLDPKYENAIQNRTATLHAMQSKSKK